MFCSERRCLPGRRSRRFAPSQGATIAATVAIVRLRYTAGLCALCCAVARYRRRRCQRNRALFHLDTRVLAEFAAASAVCSRMELRFYCAFMRIDDSG